MSARVHIVEEKAELHETIPSRMYGGAYFPRPQQRYKEPFQGRVGLGGSSRGRKALKRRTAFPLSHSTLNVQVSSLGWRGIREIWVQILRLLLSDCMTSGRPNVCDPQMTPPPPPALSPLPGTGGSTFICL